MKLEEIELEWSKDAKLDPFSLGDESLKIPLLHAKYYSYYVREKLSVEKLRNTKVALEDVLYGYFSKTLTDDELYEYGLFYQNKKVLKPDMPRAVSAHKDMVELNLRYSMAQEKTEFLKSILQLVNNRSFHIKNALEFRKFEAGG
jgi:hypothetical protein